MIPSVCTPVALSFNPSAAVQPDQWDRASQYDTVISLFPAIPSTSVSAQEPVKFSSFISSGKNGWNAFERGSSGSFDLSTLISLPDGDWSGIELVRELRQLSGLTWQQAADLVGVKPRTLHNWAAGQTVAEKNLRRLGELLAILRHIDQGYGEANRDLLLKISIDGRTLFSLLQAGEFDQVKEQVGRGMGHAKSNAALPQATAIKWGAEHFGTALSLSLDDLDEEVVPVRPAGRRPAKARRKG